MKVSPTFKVSSLRSGFLLLVLFLLASTAHAQAIPSCGGINDTGAFNTIISSFGSDTGTIQLPFMAGSRCAVKNLTIPANVTLDNTNGTGIKIISGQTLTIVGPVIGPPKLFFANALSGQGTVLFSGNTSLKRVYPQWWGAVGDGSTDNLDPIKAALVAGAGRNVHFIAGDYLTSNSLPVLGSTLVSGDGYASKLICPAAGWDLSVGTDHYGILTIINVSKVRVTNLRFYGTKSAEPDESCDGGFPGNCHTPKLIYLQGGGGVSNPSLPPVDGAIIDNCWFEHSAWEGIWQGGNIPSTLHIHITNNHFEAIAGPSAIVLNAEKSVVSNNIIQNCVFGIGVVGSHITVIGNQIYGAVGGGITTGEIGNGGFTEIAGNVIHIKPTAAGSWGGIMTNSDGTDGVMNITGNTVFVEDSAGAASGAGIKSQTNGTIDINSNSIQGNGVLYGIAAGMSATSKLSVRGNTIKLTGEIQTPNQSRGIIATTSAGTLSIQSSSNKVLGMTRANSNYAYDYRSIGGGSVIVSMAGDLKSDGYMDIGGVTYATSETDNVALFISADLAANDAYIGRTLIGQLRFVPAQQLVIASGVISLTGINGGNGLPYRQTRILVDTQGAAGSDDLDTINGGQDGDILIIASVTNTRDTTLKNGTGNLMIGSDFTLGTTADRITLMYDSGLSKWVQLTRSTN